MAGIGDILEDIGDDMPVPEDFSRLLVVVCDDSPFCLVLAGRENALCIQLFIDAHIAHPLAPPAENLLDDRRGFGVHNQPVLVVRVLQVAVLFPRTDIITVLHPGFQCGADLAGNVPGIEIVENVGERSRQLAAAGGGCGIVMVIHRDEPQVEERTDLFQELAGLHIVSAKAGEVLHHHAVDVTPAGRIDHTPEFGAHEIGAGKTVVNIDGCLPQGGIGRDEVL